MSRSLLRVLAAAAVAAVLATACGGSQPLYDLGATAACLDIAGISVDMTRDSLDYIAMDAGVGAFSVDLDGNDAQVIFERSASDAARTANSYAILSDGPSDDLARSRNVVIAWHRAPTAGEAQTVEDCLRTGAR